MRRFVQALVLALAACATAPKPPPPTTAAPPTTSALAPTAVFARYDGRELTQAEVDAAGQDAVRKLEQELYEARVDAAERLAITALVGQRARAAGQDDEAWLRQQVEAGLPAPSEDELRALYAKVKGRLPRDTPFEAVRERLADSVTQTARGERAKALFAQLKADSHFQVLAPRPPRPRKAVAAVGPDKGPTDAPVTIVVFSDFQCPYCARSKGTLDRVWAAYPGRLRVVYRHFPLSFHKDAPKAAEASLCAHEQGKFWSFHDALYDAQDLLDVDSLKLHANRLGLDRAAFTTCLDSGRMKAAVERDLAAGQELGVDGTPAYFINGLPLAGAQPEEAFRALIDEELAAPSR